MRKTVVGIGGILLLAASILAVFICCGQNKSVSKKSSCC